MRPVSRHVETHERHDARSSGIWSRRRSPFGVVRAAGRHSAVAAIADHGAYAATNMLLVVSVARAAEPEDFGRFTAIYLCVALGLTLLRAQFGQPLLYGSSPLHRQKTRFLFLSATIAAVLGAVSVAMGSTPAIIVSVAIPIVAYQDFLRYRFFGQSTPERALRSDAIWAMLQCAALLTAELVFGPTFWSGAGAWVFGCAGAALFSSTSQAPKPTRGGGVEQPLKSSTYRSHQRGFVGDAVVAFIRNQGLVLLFALYAGWGASGGLRLCFTLMGFVPVISQGLISSFLPRITSAGARRVSFARISTHLQAISLLLGGVGLIALVVAHRVGLLDTAVGADTWATAEPLLYWVLLLHVGMLLEAPFHVLVMGYVGLIPAVGRKAVSAGLQLAFAAGALHLGTTATAGVVGMVIAEVLALVMWQTTWARRKDHVAGGTLA